jgi:transaldolase
MAESNLHKLSARGQSVWIDSLSRHMLESGELKKLMKDDAVVGVTTNPTIFQKAISQGDDYDAQLKELLEKESDPKEIFLHLSARDVDAALDLFAPVHEQNGQDGYVSWEVDPTLAYDREGTFDEAMRLFEWIPKPNLYVKIPATKPGLGAIEECVAHGKNINVTLIFSLERYREVVEAYVRGLERLVARGGDPKGIHSVASFFVSRVDGKVDAALEKAGRSDLQGKAAIANARVAYESFQRIFSGPRWETLAAKGARKQRPLWASTSTKNPAYPDTLYVDELIGPDTVNTMPDATIDAARDHATPARTIDRDIPGAHRLLDQVRAAGVDIDRICGVELVEEGVASFAKAFDDLIETIGQKSAALATAGASSDG